MGEDFTGIRHLPFCLGGVGSGGSETTTCLRQTSQQSLLLSLLLEFPPPKLLSWCNLFLSVFLHVSSDTDIIGAVLINVFWQSGITDWQWKLCVCECEL